MDYNKEIEEGLINVPRVMNISKTFIMEQSPKAKHTRRNSLMLYKKKIQTSVYKKNYIYRDNLNNSVKLRKSKFNIKNDDSNSITTKTSFNDKVKKVTFSTVEIIRVANYKKYNKLNSIKKMDKKSNEGENDMCSIF